MSSDLFKGVSIKWVQVINNKTVEKNLNYYEQKDFLFSNYCCCFEYYRNAHAKAQTYVYEEMFILAY
jgi:hypothetical protein